MTGSSVAMRLVLVVAGIAIPAVLVCLSVTIHLQRACVEMDTPYLHLCTATERPTVAERILRLRQGEQPIGSLGKKMVLRAEVASREGNVVITGLSGGPVT